MLPRTLLLFVSTAVAEIVGCYLPYLWLRRGASVWVLLPAVGSLAPPGARMNPRYNLILYHIDIMTI
jgi:drug/metabolite transporter superfamily protein YnfA